jgi:hypothetical protein
MYPYKGSAPALGRSSPGASVAVMFDTMLSAMPQVQGRPACVRSRVTSAQRARCVCARDPDDRRVRLCPATRSAAWNGLFAPSRHARQPSCRRSNRAIDEILLRDPRSAPALRQ